MHRDCCHRGESDGSRESRISRLAHFALAIRYPALYLASSLPREVLLSYSLLAGGVLPGLASYIGLRVYVQVKRSARATQTRSTLATCTRERGSSYRLVKASFAHKYFFT